MTSAFCNKTTQLQYFNLVSKNREYPLFCFCGSTRKMEIKFSFHSTIFFIKNPLLKLGDCIQNIKLKSSFSVQGYLHNIIKLTVSSIVASSVL